MCTSLIALHHELSRLSGVSAFVFVLELFRNCATNWHQRYTYDATVELDKHGTRFLPVHLSNNYSRFLDSQLSVFEHCILCGAFRLILVELNHLSQVMAILQRFWDLYERNPFA